MARRHDYAMGAVARSNCGRRWPRSFYSQGTTTIPCKSPGDTAGPDSRTLCLLRQVTWGRNELVQWRRCSCKFWWLTLITRLPCGALTVGDTMSQPTIESKAASCASIAVAHGLSAVIPWAQIIQMLLSLFGTCPVGGKTPVQSIAKPDPLQEFVIVNNLLRNGYVGSRREGRAYVEVLKRVGRTTTPEQATAMLAEVSPQ